MKLFKLQKHEKQSLWKHTVISILVIKNINTIYLVVNRDRAGIELSKII